jgi:CheY-like chemotaxis protein
MIKILVVEDKDSHRKILCDMLRAEGYEILEASNGKQALEILEQEKGVDLITLDEKMPVMTGLECLTQIREKKATRDIPVVFITVYRKSEIEKLADEGISMILKPYNYPEFLEAVKSALNKRPQQSIKA